MCAQRRRHPRWPSSSAPHRPACAPPDPSPRTPAGRRLISTVPLGASVTWHTPIPATAGAEEELWRFRGPARVYESQEAAVDAILADQVKPGDVVIIRYEGPRGGPGMQEMLYPTSFLKGKGLGKV